MEEKINEIIMEEKINEIIMEKIINEIYSKMFVYFGESVVFSEGEIGSNGTGSNDTGYHKRVIHNLIVQKLNVQDILFDPNDEVHTSLSKLSLTTNFLAFLNSTIDIAGNKFVAIGMYVTKELNEKQKSLAKACLTQLKKDNTYVEIGMFDNGNINFLTPDQFEEIINCQESNHAKVLKK